MVIMNKVVVVMLLLAFIFQAIILPPSPKKLSNPEGPSRKPKIKLRDGRHLVYKEYGVPQEIAKYKVIFIHSFGGSKYEPSLITSEVLLEELGVYLVSFDRPGYGKSDPHPNSSQKSIVLDIAELADHKLGLGSKFYLIGYSMGGMLSWACLKFIPERLSGVTMLAPAINYWWPGLPSNLTKEAFLQQLPRDQWALSVAHYAPWLVYWWNTQKWFPRLSMIDGESNWSHQDLDIISKIDEEQLQEAYIVQGNYESLHRDIIIFCQNWEFDPTDLKNPFPNKEGFVHLWHGDEDCLVPVALQRYIAKKLPWIKYHELQHSGHIFPYNVSMKDVIWKTFLKGENVENGK